MEQPDYLPKDYDGIQLVGNMDELFAATFGPANVVLYPRSLTAAFNARAQAADFKALSLLLLDGLSEKDMSHEDLSEAASRLEGGSKKAAQQILDDMKAFESNDLKPALRIFIGKALVNLADYGGKIFQEGAHLFHGDGVPTRFLCCYTAPATEGLCNEDAERYIDSENYAQELAASYTAERGRNPYHPLPGLQGYPEKTEDFKRWLERNNDYYFPKPRARIFSFKIGDVFRFAGEKNYAGVPPFIHRGPPSNDDSSPRLVLVGDLKP
jgi:hypothetical protein